MFSQNFHISITAGTPLDTSSSFTTMVSPPELCFNNSSLLLGGKVTIFYIIGKGISNNGWSSSISGIPVLSWRRVNIPTIPSATPAPTDLIYLVPPPPLDPLFDILQESFFSASNYFVPSKVWLISPERREENQGMGYYHPYWETVKFDSSLQQGGQENQSLEHYRPYWEILAGEMVAWDLCLFCSSDVMGW